MILAAGLGTRLRPLTDELPKPLVPVGDRSVLAHAAAALARAGIRRVVINTHHLASAFDRDVLAHELDMEVALSFEAKVRGTAGGVEGASDLLPEGELLVHNGDIVSDVDPTVLVAAHRAHAPLATLAVLGGQAPGQGRVGLDAHGFIVRLRDARIGEEVEGADFTGAQLLSAEARALLPEHGCLVGDVYIPALLRGARLCAARAASWFSDVGTVGDYLAANRAWLAGRTYHAAPDAEVAPRVALLDTVVGGGAKVQGAGELCGCVVWPGATATAPLADAVITPHQVIRGERTSRS